jgi:hypothetical protein
MLMLHLIAGAGVAVLSGGTAAVLGQGLGPAAMAYAAGGAAGILGSAALAVLFGARREDEDEEAWIVAPPAAASAPRGAEIVPLGAARRRPAPPARRPDPRLAPDWMMAEEEAGGWPDRIPGDLRLRLREAMEDGAATPEAVWDALRGWLLERGVASPPASGARPRSPHRL